METSVVTRVARGATLASCWVFLGCVAAAALDIWLGLAKPGVWHLLPHAADPVVLWSPLVVAVMALGLTIAAAVRREPNALRLRTWFAAAAIAAGYGFGSVWFYFHPLVLY